VLLSAGHSIAVQNFNENLSILIMLGMYAALKYFHVPLHSSILVFLTLITGLMALMYRWYLHNKKHHNADSLIDEISHHEHV
jgi:hypothetical protein